MKGMRRSLFVAFLAALAGYAGGVEAAKVKPVLLKVPIAFATKLPGLGSAIVKFKEDIEAASGGSVKVKVYEPGKLVAPFEILDAVSSGKVNAGYTTAGYWAGKLPASPLFSPTTATTSSSASPPGSSIPSS